MLGIVKIWPIVRISLVKLLASLISFTFTLYFLDILHKLSPFCTIYVLLVVTPWSCFSPVLSVSLGIVKTWPMLITGDVILFLLIIASAVVPYLSAMEYSVSPFWTRYVVSVSGVVCCVVLGILSTWPTYMVVTPKSFKLASSSTVVLFAFAIDHRLSPDTIFM